MRLYGSNGYGDYIEEEDLTRREDVSDDGDGVGYISYRQCGCENRIWWKLLVALLDEMTIVFGLRGREKIWVMVEVSSTLGKSIVIVFVSGDHSFRLGFLDEEL
ncbi:unnamed protein product [Dovyalis caffra]|uniref:Uncharacterized protein n=1 Tax=Dovyalis caffra TaxID=77055 RepID=A0AAV1SN86_9ROSI|nr:unnamed protein product [Dovyalis caffra]